MATLKEVVEGIRILSGYLADGMDSNLISVQHDVIFVCGGAKEDMIDKDKDKLTKLGWHWDQREESWAKFT